MIVRHIRTSLVACLAAVAVARAGTSTDEQAVAAAAAQAGATGRRSVAVVADAIMTYPADQFSVFVRARSGSVPPEAAAAQIDVLAGRMQDLLRTAGLPLPTLATWSTPEVRPTTDGKVIASRDYSVAATSAAQAQAIRGALAPLTDPSGQIGGEAKLSSVSVAFTNAKVRADENAAKAAVRQQALANARAEAEQIAKAFGMRLGPPISVGVIRVEDVGSEESDLRGFQARGAVVFELLE